MRVSVKSFGGIEEKAILCVVSCPSSSGFSIFLIPVYACIGSLLWLYTDKLFSGVKPKYAKAYHLNYDNHIHNLSIQKQDYFY